MSVQVGALLYLTLEYVDELAGFGLEGAGLGWCDSW